MPEGGEDDEIGPRGIDTGDPPTSMLGRPPGWYRNPLDEHDVRCWDGNRWTQRAPRPVTAPPPASVTPDRPPPPPPNTPAGWYYEPTDRSLARYWDGSQWATETVPAHTISGRPDSPPPVPTFNRPDDHVAPPISEEGTSTAPSTPTSTKPVPGGGLSTRSWVLIGLVLLLLATTVTAVVVVTARKSAAPNQVRYVNATLAQMLIPSTAMPGFTAISPNTIEDAASSLTQPASIASLPCLNGALQSDPERQAEAVTGFVQSSTGMGLLEALTSFPSTEVARAKFNQGTQRIHRCSNLTFNYAGVPLSMTLTRMSFPAFTQVLEAFRFTINGQGITVGYDVIIAQRNTVDVALIVGPTDPQSRSVVSFARRALGRITGAPGVVDIGANNASGACTAPGNVDYIQGGVAPGGPTYVVPPGAVAIRSWSIAAGDPGGAAQVEVWHEQPKSGGWYLMLAAGPTENLNSNVLNTFKESLRVRPGDVLGLGQDSSSLACGVTTTNPADDWESDWGELPWTNFDAPSYRFLVFPQGPFEFKQDGDLQLNLSAQLLVTVPSNLHPYIP